MTIKIVCPTCQEPRERHEDHDAFACRACDVWLEERCGSDCEFCSARPEKPSDADWGQE